MFQASTSLMLGAASTTNMFIFDISKKSDILQLSPSARGVQPWGRVAHHIDNNPD